MPRLPIPCSGGVAEWSIAPVLKTGNGQPFVSSNLTASAKSDPRISTACPIPAFTRRLGTEMSVTTAILAALPDEMEAICASVQPLNEWNGVELQGMDLGKIAALHSLLTGESLAAILDAYEAYLISQDDVFVFRLADELVEKLLDCDEELLIPVANELVAAEDFEDEPWDPEDLATAIFEVAELALLADSQEQQLYVWMRIE